MILRELRIENFGGITDFQCSFGPGLNILLGPNEAGKSTLFHVVDFLLFGSIKPRKRSPEDQALMRWFPAAGGDTIRAEMKIFFDEKEKEAEIRKQWGVNPGVELRFGGSGKITDEGKVKERIEGAAGLNPATVRQVFLLRQSSLRQTIEEFSTLGDAVEDLTDLLQRTIMETDGVSVQAFLDRLEKKYQEYFGRWDREKEYPENSRGIENPWKSGAGEIVNAWYRYKQLEDRLGSLKKTDVELQAVQKEYTALKKELEEAKNFVELNEKAVKRAEQKRTFEAELSGVLIEIERLKETHQEWITALSDIERLDKEQKGLGLELVKAEENRHKAEEAGENREVREKFQRAVQAKQRYEALQGELRTLHAMPEKEYRELRDLWIKREKTAEALKAGKLRGKVRAKKDLKVSLGKGTQEPEERDIFAGNSVEVEGDGRLRFAHEDWEIEVFSGDIDYPGLEVTKRLTEDRIEELTGQYGVGSPEEAEKERNLQALKEREAASAKETLEKILEEEDFDTLERRTEELSDGPPPEDYSRTVRKCAELESKIEMYTERLGQCKKKIKNFEAAHGDQDTLYERLGELYSRQKKLEKEMQNSGEIPARFQTADEFIRFFEEERKRAEELTERVHEAKLQCTRLEGVIPDISLEELEEQAEAARRRFEKVREAGEALLKVRREAHKLWNELQANPYTPFYQKVESYVSSMSGEKYTQVGRDAAIPATLVTPEGHPLAFSQLSAGTKDLFALAVRLAMAEFFLENRAGFLLLDDPLVELDPERQKKAAELIARFSDSRQCIFFTCHPSAAALFPGSRVIELSPGFPG